MRETSQDTEAAARPVLIEMAYQLWRRLNTQRRRTTPMRERLWVSTSNTSGSPPHHQNGDITQSSIDDYVKNRSKGLELKVMMGVILIFPSLIRPTTIGDHRDRPYQALRRRPPSPPLPTVPSTHTVAVPQGLWSPTVKLLAT